MTLDGDYTVDEETNFVTLSKGCQVTPIGEGETLRISAKAKEDEQPGIFDYAVSYATGKVGGAAHNVRTDTITNSRHGIRLVKKDWNGHGLAGAMFRLTDAAGSPIGAGSYTSEEDGLITIAYVNVGTEYTITETKAPSNEAGRYYGTDEPMKFKLRNDGSVKITGDGDGYCTAVQGSGSDMPSIIIKNRPLKLTAVKKGGHGDGDAELLAGVHFALYREVTVDGVTSMDIAPIAGFEDLVSDKNGVIPGINQMLDPGTYYLKEKTAPAGYDVMPEAVRFMISRTGKVTLSEADASASAGNAAAADNSGSAELSSKVLQDGTMVYTLTVWNGQKIPAPTGVDQRHMPYVCMLLLALLLLSVMLFGRHQRKASKVVK